MKTFRFRKRSPIGGLAVDIDAEVDVSGVAPSNAVQIYRKVWLELPHSALHWRDAAWLMFGISVHSDVLNALHPQGLTIKVGSLSFPASDYVPEAAAFAIEGWLREEFKLPPVDIGVEFDSVNSRYVFSWGNRMPFSEGSSGVPALHTWR
ncbi:hypothetical protein ABZT06_19830 [Streptomyces sp. NPDC005483]|uniref:hypothetical protein n=1 Tax=Streptomyces sp. NPDC005483 TaxID=3154882 RepID=UPI0033B445BA